MWQAALRLSGTISRMLMTAEAPRRAYLSAPGHAAPGAGAWLQMQAGVSCGCHTPLAA